MISREPAPPADPVAAVVHPDPYPYYGQLRAGPPLAFDHRLGLWVAARAEVVAELLAHPDCQVRPSAEPVPRALLGTATGGVFGELVRMNDGERHRGPSLALRGALAGVEPDRVRALAERVTAAARLERADSAALSRWLFELPVSVVAALLGFRCAEWPAVVAAVGAFVAGLSPLAGADEHSAASAAAEQLLARFGELLRQADAAPDSPVARLQREAAARGWTDPAAWAANLLGLLMQTHDACAGLLGNGIVALARQPAWRDRLQAEPGAGHALIEQVMRLDPPVQNTRRFVARACRVAGVALAAGDAVLLVLAAAQRDPAADTVLGFGQGRHGCPGEAVARSLAAAALQALLLASPSLGLDRLGWSYRPSANARVPVFQFQGDPSP